MTDYDCHHYYQQLSEQQFTNCSKTIHFISIYARARVLQQYPSSSSSRTYSSSRQQQPTAAA